MRRMVMVLVAGVLLLSACQPSGSWSETTSMATGRSEHTATTLESGRVLVAGGRFYDETIDEVVSLASVERYEPSTSRWLATASMGTPRAYHAAVRLADGRVLVTGGTPTGYSDGEVASTEIYDPDTQSWTPAGNMRKARSSHQAVVLASGKVLVVGGDYPVTAEVYDPATDTWKLTDGRKTEATGALAALPDGKALLAGGPIYGDFHEDTPGTPEAEIYDSATNRWMATASMSAGRFSHTATTLLSGKVLVVGGYSFCTYYSDCAMVASAELYDPTVGAWSAAGSLPRVHGDHTATRLADGTVLVVGGFEEPVTNAATANAEVYTPSSNSWSSAGEMNAARYDHATAALANGKALVSGYDGNTAELYTP